MTNLGTGTVKVISTLKRSVNFHDCPHSVTRSSKNLNEPRFGCEEDRVLSDTLLNFKAIFIFQVIFGDTNSIKPMRWDRRVLVRAVDEQRLAVHLVPPQLHRNYGNHQY